MHRILREPLVHFALLGAVLFAAYRLVAPADRATSTVVISSDQIASIAAQLRGVHQRPPTAEELARAVDARVHDEILYREGVALGLDRDDPVIRNRVKQKMELLADDAATVEPSDADLQAYLVSHPELFALPATVSFEQIYFDPTRHGAALASDLTRARDRLRSGGSVSGDQTLLPRLMETARLDDVETSFGSAFEKAVQALPVATWSEPVRSTYGYHLVRVAARTDARMPSLADARDVVFREWTHQRTVEAKERLYRSLRARYSVVIAPLPDTRPQTARAGDAR
jgi:hypothetical protein